MKRKIKLERIPTWLKHKPIVTMSGYGKMDGIYKNDTDVVGISIGKAQWSDENFVPSVKVWRDVYNPDNDSYKVSRQSEETTLTRALDMALLVVKAFDYFVNENNMDDIVTVFGKTNIEITENAELRNQLIGYYNIKNNKQDLKAHMDILYATLKNLYAKE